MKVKGDLAEIYPSQMYAFTLEAQHEFDGRRHETKDWIPIGRTDQGRLT